MKPSLETIAAIRAAIADVTVIGSATGELKKLKLFQNNFTPTAASVPADFTEANFDGYVSKPLGEGAAFDGVDALSGLNIVQALPGADAAWQVGGGMTGNQTIYGWYVTDSVNSKVIGFQLFPTPIVLSTPGQSIDIPDVTLMFDNAAFV